jgi:hypothetical protein
MRRYEHHLKIDGISAEDIVSIEASPHTIEPLFEEPPYRREPSVIIVLNITFTEKGYLKVKYKLEAISLGEDHAAHS